MIQDNGAPPEDKGRTRKAIRKKVVELLKAADISDVSGKVYPNASVPSWQEELPVVLVYQRNESASEYAQAPREYQRTFNLAIEIVAEGEEENDQLETPGSGLKSLEDILDDIAEEIECALSIDDTLDNVCSESMYQSTEFEFDSAGGRPIGSARLNYAVTYYTMSPRDIEKQGVVDDFSKANIDYQLTDDENINEATDELDIPIV